MSDAAAPGREAPREASGRPGAPGGASGAAHLLPEVAATLEWPRERRIAFANRDLWIGHGAATRALAKLEDMLAHPRVEQMPCLLVAAASRNGKSTLLKRFAYAHPFDLAEVPPAMPVLLLQMPAKPKESDFWTAVLIAMKVSHRVNAPPAVKREQAILNLRAYRCRMLVIDEIHNVLQGTVPEQRQFLALLKNLTNELMIAIVTAGTQDAVRTLKTDEQFGDRFDVAALPRWRLDKDYVSLLRTWERLMPLRLPSELHGREIATKLFDMSNRTIGSMTKIVKAATVAAIKDGTERITPGTLEETGYQPLRDFRAQDM